MATSDYLSAYDLKSVTAGGLIREDVLDQIFNLDNDIPTPFLDAIGTGSFDNSYSEWTSDTLAAVDLTNAAVDGADASTSTSATGARVGNHAQISRKAIAVTDRAQGTDQIGRSDEMGYQTAKRLQELRRDVEAIALSNQASVADDGNSTAGKSAGFGAWCVTNDSHGTGGSATGFNTSTKVVATPTVGDSRSLTYTMVRDMIEAVYLVGGNPTILMSVPQITKRLAAYLFTTPNAAVPTATVSGSSAVNQVSNQYIDVFRTDFGFTMKIVPNRLQQVYSSGDATPSDVANVYGIDPSYVQLALLDGWKVAPLAKLGLADRKQVSVDWMLKVLLEKAHFVIRDINPTGTVTTP